jgi:hypothetical protein
MGLNEFLTPEVVTAIGVCFGALLGGLSALIKELRQPRQAVPEVLPPAPREDEPTVLVEEGLQHLGRTMWIIEKRLSDRLQRIELKLGGQGDDQIER